MCRTCNHRRGCTKYSGQHVRDDKRRTIPDARCFSDHFVVAGVARSLRSFGTPQFILRTTKRGTTRRTVSAVPPRSYTTGHVSPRPSIRCTDGKGRSGKRGDSLPYRIVDHLPEIKRRRDSYGHFFFELATISLEHIVSYRT